MIHSPKHTDSEQIVPVVSEEVEVGKRVVDTEKGVRFTKTVSEREQIVKEYRHV